MALEAGKRDRMVWYAMHTMIESGLDQLGWLDDPVTNGLDRLEVQIPWGGFPDGEPVPVNAVVVMPEDTDYSELETGSNAERRDRVFVIDVYAEDHAVGVHLRGDISAMLRGHHPSIGRDRNILEVEDLDLATPVVVATMDIVNVRDDRARGGTDPWERYWYSIVCVVEDEGWDP